MSIKIGSGDINNLYLGSTPISKVYVGSTQVYPVDTFVPPTTFDAEIEALRRYASTSSTVIYNPFKTTGIALSAGQDLWFKYNFVNVDGLATSRIYCFFSPYTWSTTEYVNMRSAISFDAYDESFNLLGSYPAGSTQKFYYTEDVTDGIQHDTMTRYLNIKNASYTNSSYAYTIGATVENTYGAGYKGSTPSKEDLLYTDPVIDYFFYLSTTFDKFTLTGAQAGGIYVLMTANADSGIEYYNTSSYQVRVYTKSLSGTQYGLATIDPGATATLYTGGQFYTYVYIMTNYYYYTPSTGQLRCL